jgi:hypothetical protein
LLSWPIAFHNKIKYEFANAIASRSRSPAEADLGDWQSPRKKPFRATAMQHNTKTKRFGITSNEEHREQNIEEGTTVRRRAPIDLGSHTEEAEGGRCRTFIALSLV